MSQAQNGAVIQPVGSHRGSRSENGGAAPPPPETIGFFTTVPSNPGWTLNADHTSLQNNSGASVTHHMMGCGKQADINLDNVTRVTSDLVTPRYAEFEIRRIRGATFGGFGLAVIEQTVSPRGSCSRLTFLGESDAVNANRTNWGLWADGFARHNSVPIALTGFAGYINNDRGQVFYDPVGKTLWFGVNNTYFGAGGGASNPSTRTNPAYTGIENLFDTTAFNNPALGFTLAADPEDDGMGFIVHTRAGHFAYGIPTGGIGFGD